MSPMWYCFHDYLPARPHACSFASLSAHSRAGSCLKLTGVITAAAVGAWSAMTAAGAEQV